VLHTWSRRRHAQGLPPHSAFALKLSRKCRIVHATLRELGEHCFGIAAVWGHRPLQPAVIGAGREVFSGIVLIDSVASIFVCRWDGAVHNTVPAALRNRLGIRDRRA
jgi:hypothetical protein